MLPSQIDTCHPRQGGSPPSSQPEAPPRRTELRIVPPGGRCQLFRQPFARWASQLRYDERGLLVWLLVEVDRRRRGPALRTSKAALAEALGLERKRLSRMLARLEELGVVAWQPGTPGLDGEVVVLAYDEVVAQGRRERAGDFAQLWCGQVDDDLARLGFNRWALLLTVAVEVGSVTRAMSGPATGLAKHLGLTWRRLRPLAEDLVDAGEIEWRPGTAGKRAARIEIVDYARMVAGAATDHDPGEVRIERDGNVACRESGHTLSRIGTRPIAIRDAPIANRDALPGLSRHTQEAQEEPQESTSCGTPLSDVRETRARPAGGKRKPSRIVDQEHDHDHAGDAFLDALAVALVDNYERDAAHRLDHARARRTRAIRRLRSGGAERLAAGWGAEQLAQEVIGTRDLDDVSHLDAVLASRLDAVPLDPRHAAAVVTDDGAHARCSGATRWIELVDGDALVCVDCADQPGPLQPRPFVVVQEAIVTEAAPEAAVSAPLSASEGLRGASTVAGADEGADGDLHDVFDAFFGRRRTVIDVVAAPAAADETIEEPEPEQGGHELDECTEEGAQAITAPEVADDQGAPAATPPPEAIARLREILAATAGPPRRHSQGPVQAFGSLASTERPVGRPLSASGGRPEAITPEPSPRASAAIHEDRFGLRARAEARARGAA